MVIPCLNEAASIERCVTRRAARRSRARAGTARSSSPTTARTTAAPSSRAAAGALVVHEPRRGYGSAYLAGFAAARGDYIVMADADLTYDFGDIPRFVDEARRGRRPRDGRPHEGHPARRDAVAAPLRRQPGAHRDPQPLLPHRRPRRALRHARGPALGPAPPRPAHDRDGVRLRDGDPRRQGAARDRRDPDPLPPARGRVEALELPRRLAPPALPARAQPHLAVHRPGRGDGGARRADRADRAAPDRRARARVGPARDGRPARCS